MDRCPLNESDGAEFEELGVLIVGAGRTGLTLAAQLHALGAGVRIFDRQLDRVREYLLVVARKRDG